MGYTAEEGLSAHDVDELRVATLSFIYNFISLGENLTILFFMKSKSMHFLSPALPHTHLQDDDDKFVHAHRQPLLFHLITAAATTLHHHHPPLHIIIAALHYWHTSSIIFRAITITLHCATNQ